MAARDQERQHDVDARPCCRPSGRPRSVKRRSSCGRNEGRTVYCGKPPHVSPSSPETAPVRSRHAATTSTEVIRVSEVYRASMTAGGSLSPIEPCATNATTFSLSSISPQQLAVAGRLSRFAAPPVRTLAVRLLSADSPPLPTCPPSLVPAPGCSYRLQTSWFACLRHHRFPR